ncbi:3-carboxy-cis,cis-muconate cycloisomerase [Allomesorhizobium alhagi]|jgi:3-carboxy-cis,cis-muconate cycloisomerase|uniref:3-carboxy-cis,cis-muconate cycloisomerase n=1 Tax=Mesorhizobium alhagi CCNWXJ12-2 TaxID=1107882 RepID=H0HJJ3_9HYPH|nr:3-carboxy-cis,cis-muconate cycloisomerase [Mesorhizobium alhagi]EHK59053.1 3-carboxy-cis,cis-muconate cycloisomerase [Mesorhizobium alhagi CCNWXJ12-2]
MAVSPFDHPFLSGLFGDKEIEALLGIDAEIDAMLQFEIALAEAEAEAGLIPAEAASAIAKALAGFKPDTAALRSGMARDGVAVPELVRQMREKVGAPHADRLHFGATSQDVIDTAFVLRLKPVLDLFDRRLAELTERFDQLDKRFGKNPLMGRTRMQAAIEISAGARIRSWRDPLVRHRARLEAVRPSLLTIQFGGAAGTLDKLGGKGEAIRAAMAQRLGLVDVPQWQSQRDGMAEFASFLSLLTGSLAKFGQDVALLAQAGDEIALSGGGSSSAMPHKQNPVAAETLVTLGRFNATQLSGMHHALIHEQERSGSAWSLEWLILPQMIAAAGSALRLAAALTGRIDRVGA